MNAGPGALAKPIRTVLRWQLIATVVLTVLGGAFGGTHAALSAAFGGAVSVCATGLAAVVALRRNARSAAGILTGALLAEGVKIGLIVILLWLVLTVYRDVVVPVLIGSFLATVLIFSMAFLVREND